MSERILIRCPNWVGDAVMATPALRAVRRRFPDAHIALAAPARIRQVPEPGSFHDEFIPVGGRHALLGDVRRLRQERFTIGVLLTNSFQSALLVRLARVPRRIGFDRDGRGWLLTDRVQPHRVGRRFVPEPVLEAYLELARTLGCPTEDRRMELAVAPEDEAAVTALLAGKGIAPDRPIVVLTPGAAFGSAKLWPADRFAAVADHLRERLGAAVLVAAASAEADVVRAVIAAMKGPAVNLAERGTSLGILKALVRRAAILVTNDSGPRHFAAAFDRPVVTIFGPTDPLWSETHHAKEICLLPDCSCAPCQRRVCPIDHRCVQGITVDMAIRACDDFLRAVAAGAPIDHSRIGVPFSRDPKGSVAAGGEHVLITPAYASVLAAHGLDTVDSVMNFEEGHVLRTLAVRDNVRIDLTDADGTALTFYAKRHRAPSIGEQIRRILTGRRPTSFGRREWDAAAALAESGIPAAERVAVGERRIGPIGRKSFFITRGLTGYRPADDVLRDLPPADRTPLLDRIALFAHRFHAAGFNHRDFYLCHIFVAGTEGPEKKESPRMNADERRSERDGESRLSQECDPRLSAIIRGEISDARRPTPDAHCQPFTLALIDLQRVERFRLFRRRWLVKDIAQLAHSARGLITPADWDRFLCLYFGVPRLTASHHRFAAAVARKAARIERHDRRRRPNGVS